MGFTVLLDGSIRADTAEEALALAAAAAIRASLGGPTAREPPTRLDGKPKTLSGTVRPQRNRWRFVWSVGRQKFHGGTFDTEAEAQSALDATIAARAAGQPLPVFPKRICAIRSCGKCGQVGHDVRRCGKPPRKLMLTDTERRAALSAGMTRVWAERRAARAGAEETPTAESGEAELGAPGSEEGAGASTEGREAGNRAAPAPDELAPGKLTGPKRPKPGMIQQRGYVFALRINVDGKATWAGSYPTREEAESARDRIHAARLRGEPLPEFPRKIKARTCKRCGELGHDLRVCTGVPLPPKPVIPPKDPARPWTKEEKSAAMRAGWARRHAELAAQRAAGVVEPKPVKQPKGARKGSPEYRAAVSEGMRRVWAARRARLGTAAVAPRIARAPRPPAPARARPALPPRCIRCIKVGHIAEECPLAEPAPTLGNAILALSNAAHYEAEGFRVSPLLPGDPDDDEGTDLTDLVDVPEPPPASAVTVIPPPPIEFPAPLVRLPLFDDEPTRPRTRADCVGQARPCPFVSCAHHLYLVAIDEARRGSPNYGLEPWQLPETCVLDVADRGGVTLEEAGRILGVTRERARQLEERGLARAAKNAKRQRMDFEEPSERGSNAAEDHL